MGMKLPADLEAKVLELSGIKASGEPVSYRDEAEFQADVIHRAKELGWRVYHTHDSRKSEAGFPDLKMVRAGVLVFAELKTDKGKLSAPQASWGEDLAATRAEYYVWRPNDWPLIEEVLAPDVAAGKTSA